MIKKTSEDRIHDAIELLIAEVNGNRDTGHQIAMRVMSQHRTLQASFWRAILDGMKYYGDNATHDLRNEGAVDMCRKLHAHASDPDNEIYIPYI